MPDQIEMLRPSDIAERLDVTASRVYQMISDRVIPAVRVGGAIRIPRAAWEAWLRGRSEEALATLKNSPEAAPTPSGSRALVNRRTTNGDKERQ